MSEVTWMNAGTPHIVTDAVNLFIGTECIALVRNEKSIKLVQESLREKGAHYSLASSNHDHEDSGPSVLCDDPLNDWEDFG